MHTIKCNDDMMHDSKKKRKAMLMLNHTLVVRYD